MCHNCGTYFDVRKRHIFVEWKPSNKCILLGAQLMVVFFFVMMLTPNNNFDCAKPVTKSNTNQYAVDFANSVIESYAFMK